MGTNDFLIGLMEQHKKMAWMLRSFLEGKHVYKKNIFIRAITFSFFNNLSRKATKMGTGWRSG